MGAPRKPRKRHTPRRVDADAVEVAIALATKLRPEQRASFRQPLRAALEGLRTGRGGWPAWNNMADGMNVAEQLALRGIASDRLPEILAAQEALHHIHRRQLERGTWTLRAAELTALRIGRFFHFVQIKHCSQGEMKHSIQAVLRRVSQALAGNAGRDAIVCVGLLQQQQIRA
jgi:hypothetical protein